MSRFSLIVALAFSAYVVPGDCFRMAKKEEIKGHSTLDGPKMIEGVPVYNYDKAFNAGGVSSLAESSGTENTTDKTAQKGTWMIFFKNAAKVKEFCAEHPCIDQGEEIPFAEVSETENELASLLRISGKVVEFVEPDLKTYIIPEIPDAEGESLMEVGASRPWGLNRIGVNRRQYSGKGVHVYVLDTGVRTTHNDFGGRAIPTLDLSSGRRVECRGSRSCAVDTHGHGTHCAGSVAGTQHGVAPGATIHGVKVLGDDGTGSGSWSISALDWITTRGQRPAVVSMSLGAKGNSRSESRAIDTASRKGVTVVVAAGNENDDACNYSPAFAPSAITVGSTDSRDRRSSFSNYGQCVDIFAPGSSIKSLSHRSNSGTTTMSGTSMACPHVSGATALLLQADPSQSSTQIMSRLRDHGETSVITGLPRATVNLLLSVKPLVGGRASSPTLKIVSASGLKNTDESWWGRLSDPYCVCSMPGKQVKTNAVDDDLSPAWGTEAPLIGFGTDDSLTCEVFNRNFFSDDSLGKVTLAASTVLGGFEGDLRLSTQGTLRLKIT